MPMIRRDLHDQLGDDQSGETDGNNVDQVIVKGVQCPVHYDGTCFSIIKINFKNYKWTNTLVQTDQHPNAKCLVGQ